MEVEESGGRLSLHLCGVSSYLEGGDLCDSLGGSLTGRWSLTFMLRPQECDE